MEPASNPAGDASVARPAPSDPAAPLLTERLLLRPWHDDAADLDAYAALASDAEVMRFVGAGVPIAREQSAAQLTGFVEHWRVHGYGLRAIVARPEAGPGAGAGAAAAGADPAPVLGFAGVVRAAEPGVRPGDVEIGWRLARTHWGRGYATEAAVAVRDHAFERLRLARLVAFVRPGNVASLGVARKLGMRPLKDGLCRRGVPMRILVLDNPRAATR